MKELNAKTFQERQNYKGLKQLALEELPYDKSIEISKEQDESYKKCMFFTELRKAIRKGNKE